MQQVITVCSNIIWIDKRDHWYNVVKKSTIKYVNKFIDLYKMLQLYNSHFVNFSLSCRVLIALIHVW